MLDEAPGARPARDPRGLVEAAEREVCVSVLNAITGQLVCDARLPLGATIWDLKLAVVERCPQIDSCYQQRLLVGSGEPGSEELLQDVFSGAPEGSASAQLVCAKVPRDKLAPHVRSLLGRIRPDNRAAVVERLASVELSEAKELELVIGAIYLHAQAEPQYCESYADMVQALGERYPEFPASRKGEPAESFTRLLLIASQDAFESLDEALQPEAPRRRDGMLACMRLLGHLFLRGLFSYKVIGRVVRDLSRQGRQDLPEEDTVESVCELLEVCGHALEGTGHGTKLMRQLMSHLIGLEQRARADGEPALGAQVRARVRRLSLASYQRQKSALGRAPQAEDATQEGPWKGPGPS